MTTPSLYKTYCKTFAIARAITGTGNTTTDSNHAFHGFRCFPEYRTDAGKQLRNQVYQAIKTQRKGREHA